MGISALGIGSGLDVNGIVSQLMAAEQIPLDRLKSKEGSYNNKISAYGQIKSAVSSFQAALKGLSESALSARTATSSNTAVASVSASSEAMPGNYAIQVIKLAQPQILASSGLTSATEKLGAGTMSIKVGSKDLITIPDGDYSLNSLTTAINATNAGVTASIVNDGQDKPYRLVISSTGTGTSNTISITAGGGMQQFDSTAATMKEMQAAQDANITINNINVTKSSNTITDAIAGVTLNLVKADSTSTTNVTVAQDKNAVKTAVTNFVSAFNMLNSTIKNMTAYDAVTKKSAILNGDQGATSVLTSLRMELGKNVSEGGFANLLDIGVSFQKDGKLSVDDAKLQKALDTKFSDVAKLFSSTDGYATRLTSWADDILGSKGVIASRTEGLQSANKSTVASQEALQKRLEVTEKRLKAQFTALDNALSKMQSTSNYLTQQLATIASYNE